jgi:hypothetical protein
MALYQCSGTSRRNNDLEALRHYGVLSGPRINARANLINLMTNQIHRLILILSNLFNSLNNPKKTEIITA